ncbi:hypothetical protein PRUB_a0700 [Pseudoalteromonas rubra]|uniref:Uncharacterized protein n=1 Tax=Pseudoalteromonas rubra TaxID=43658 RepID=A0A8T0C821_9GAMM|nr:hypothetical protein [Pseudoalteromonas rubra]KAF7786212.1 hypothetical protein PRUB_a0700 [Pseudoalteromonas rubra]
MEEIDKILTFYNSQAGLVNSLWNFYAIVVLGIVGFLFTHKDLFKVVQNQIYLAIIFLFFASSNAYALYGSQSILYAAGLEISAQVNALPKDLFTDTFRNALINEKSATIPFKIMLYHLFLDIMVLTAMFVFPRTDDK